MSVLELCYCFWCAYNVVVRAATKSLQSCENAHKHTTSELQRTRSTLHALRATHQTEIKKVEKEKERMVERWSKLSDAQLKAGSLRAGLTCANLDVVEASDVQLRGKGQGFLDVALEQAESARQELYEQNRKLRGSLLSAANQLQSVLHAARTAGDPEYREEVCEAFLHLFTAPTEVYQIASTSICEHAVLQLSCRGSGRDLEIIVHVLA